MIEKCSIGNMSYNIQNITLIILILILIIVIIYYLRNSSTKHNELIEKYTTPTDIKSDESYNTHNAIANSLINSEFPTSGTEVTLRACQVQFNNKFDDNPNDTVRYVYEDGWQEIATLKEPGVNSTFNDVPIKIISRSNETNQDAITNYSERSKCFRKMSATDNKYRYQGNALINYRTGNNLTNGTHSQLKVGADGALEDYMEMKFNLDPLNTSEYYNNLKTSICSLRYSNTLGGTSLGDKELYRLTLNARYQITAINQITINSTNNHIFTVNSTTNLAALLTSSDRTISYVYNGKNFVYKNKLNNTEIQSDGKNNIDVEIYTFNRELLCNRENEENVKYQTIKSYKIIDNNKIDVNTILKATSGDVEAIIENTNFPGTATDQSYSSKDSLLTAINERIKSEKDTANASVNTAIERYNRDITTTEGERKVFLDSINTKATFFDKIFDADTDEIRRNFLVSESGLISGLELNKLGYTTQDVSAYETILTTTQEPSFSKIVNNNEEDIYTIETYTDTSSPYTITFDKATICSILIVGGGGGGAGFNGGGGAGAVLYSSTIELPANTYTIKVGKGGDGTSAWKDDTTGGNGGNSSISSSGITYEAIGGGGGGQRRDGYNRYLGRKGEDGGSGGGGSHSDISTPNNYGGLSNKNTYTGWTSLGNPGGEGKDGLVPTGYGGGGGGGAGGVGANAGTNEGGSGGVGVNLSYIFGTKVGDNGWFGGGGGGGSWTGTAGKGGSGGKGGGGNAHGGNGIANTGGGGGGGGDGAPSGNGGSGIVIIKYKNVPEQDGDEKKITLKYENNKIEATTNMVAYRNNIGVVYSITITGVGNPSGNIWGTDTYTDDSDIVKAAVHAGVISNGETKTVYIEMLAGQKSYTGSTKNNIQSASFASWPSSYKFVELQKLNYTTTLPIQTTVNINGNVKTLNAGTYEIIMDPSGSEIRNQATKASIGRYAHTDGNKLTFKYAMSRTLSQLHELSTTFSGTQYKNSIANEKYSLGTKAINKITKYRIYIYKKHSVNHTIQLYAGDKLLTYGTDYTTSGSNQETTGVPTITLYNFYITINKTISGAIYLKSDNPIFYIDETSRTTFNNTTDTQFATKVDNLTASGTPTSDNSTTTLARLNIMFKVKEATDAKATEEGKLITYDITRPSGSHAQITIDYKSNLVSRTSLDNLAFAYNTISGYSPQGSGGITEILNANFGDILDSAPTDIDEYISYEFPSPPTDTQITPSERTARFNIKSQATKYVYFKKRGGGQITFFLSKFAL